MRQNGRERLCQLSVLWPIGVCFELLPGRMCKRVLHIRKPGRLSCTHHGVGTMRVIPEKPIEILRTLARDHAVPFYMPLDQLAWVQGQMPAPAEVPAFADPSCTAELDVGALSTRIVLHCDAGLRFDIVAAFGPPDMPGQIMILLTHDRRVVMAIQTEASISPDKNLIQVAGAEPGIMLMSPEAMSAQRGKRLYKGDSVRGFDVEERIADGVWRRKQYELKLPAGSWREINSTTKTGTRSSTRRLLRNEKAG